MLADYLKFPQYLFIKILYYTGKEWFLSIVEYFIYCNFNYKNLKLS